MNAAAGDLVPLGRWDGIPVETLRQRWRVPRLEAYRQVGSTNDVARAMAEAGAAAGATVLAEEQTAGRGRRGRSWVAPPGSSLLLSVVLRPAVDADAEIGTVPLRVGLAVARALEAVAPVTARIKWPNDILIGDAKVAGILCEGAVDRRRGGFIVAGIGVNVSQRPEEFPAGVAARAGSILGVCGVLVSRAELAGSILAGLRALCAEAGPIRGTLASELAARDALAGLALTVDGEPAGTACGLSADGSLLVMRDGRTRVVRTGTVRLDATDP